MNEFWIHTGTVETWAGVNAEGDAYNPPADVIGFLDDQVRVVIGPDGDQVTSTATFYTDLTHRAVFTPRSRFTINSRTCTVVDVKARDSGPLGLPDHLEIVLN